MKLSNKGFNMIELIVVIAIIAILVLLAMPRFLGYVTEARVTLIKNDVKVSEKVAKSEMVDNDKYPDSWQPVNISELRKLVKEKKLYDIKGIVVNEEDVEEGDYVRLEDGSFNTKLDGSFYVNQGGKGYYEDTRAGKITENEETVPPDNNGDGDGNGNNDGGNTNPDDNDGGNTGDQGGSGEDNNGGPGDSDNGDNSGNENEEEKKADKSELENIIEEAEGKDEDEYTEETWKDLEDAVNKGKDVLDDEDATQEKVDEAVDEIVDAIDKLEPKPEKSNIMRLDEVPLGSTVYDSTWNWRHRNGSNGAPSKVVPEAFVPIQWTTVARNHYSPVIAGDEHVTLMSEYIIVNYNYSTISRGSREDQQTKKYEKSIVHDYLTNTFLASISQWDSAQNFLKQLVEVRIPYIDIYGSEKDGDAVPSHSSGTMRAKVFVPSYKELNKSGLGMNVGTPWEWFKDPQSSAHIAAKSKDVNGNDATAIYWTRTHSSASYNISSDPTGTRFFVVSILQTGGGTWGYGDSAITGIRPVLNLKADTMVELQLDGRYKIIY